MDIDNFALTVLVGKRAEEREAEIALHVARFPGQNLPDPTDLAVADVTLYLEFQRELYLLEKLDAVKQRRAAGRVGGMGETKRLQAGWGLVPAAVHFSQGAEGWRRLTDVCVMCRFVRPRAQEEEGGAGGCAGARGVRGGAAAPRRGAALGALPARDARGRSDGGARRGVPLAARAAPVHPRAVLSGARPTCRLAASGSLSCRRVLCPLSCRSRALSRARARARGGCIRL